MVLEAVLWEKHAAPENRGEGEGPQEPITRQIVNGCDCAIGIFWNRIGTPTQRAPGGAVEEVQRMMTILKRPVMLYFSDMPIAPSKIDDQQKAQLKEFKAAMKVDGLVWEYDTIEDFRTDLSLHLDIQIRNWFCTPGSVVTKEPIPANEELRADEADLDLYHSIVKEELGYIRMLGMPGIESIKVNLNEETFVPLRLSKNQKEDSSSKHQEALEEHEGDAHILYPDEIMKRAFRKRRMLLVLGDPGAGKTTLLKYYALCALEQSSKLGFAVTPKLFYLPLRELVRDKTGNNFDSLPANLESWVARHHHTIQTPLFDKWLRSGVSLVLFDGLDEISNTRERKEVCRWIDRAWSGFGTARFVVTSRATGYRKEEGIELEVDHERADVQDFTPVQQERFLRNWFTAAFLRDPREEGDDEAKWEAKQRADAERRTTTMVAYLNIEKNKGLRQLAAIPMMLQIMAILWKERDFMPENRLKLYEASLDYLLEFRDKRRNIKPLLSATHARQVLAPVSLWMQATLQKDEAPRADMHTVMQEWLDTLNTSESSPDAATFCDYLVKRAGLLVDSVGKEYLFRHKSFREYLAGVQLKEDRPYEQLQKLVTHFGEDWWSEPLRFFIASVDASVFDAFMEKLFNSPQSEELSVKQQLLLQTIMEEAKGQKVDAFCKKLLDPETTANRQRVILDCLKTIRKSAALNPLEQFRALKLAKNSDVASRAEGVILALGGIALLSETEESGSGKTKSYRNPNEERAEYILIPGGRYLYSVTEKEERVEDLYVAKYPVTNRLYRTFIASLQATGAGNTRFSAELERIADESVWGAGFGDYLKEGKNKFSLFSRDKYNLAALFHSKFDEDRKFGGEQQPVVGVTWYDACAYCLWLSMAEGRERKYRLLSEVEWEWAAGGKQGTSGERVRPYPWPEERGRAKRTSTLLNCNQNVGATTPVGSYPDGVTPEGLYDMAGNVWEWCLDWYAENGTFINPLLSETGSYRVIRGGGWDDNAKSCLSAFRGGSPPGNRSNNVGFRPVFVP
ncbi:MAG: SUMF1/EgtB/PvdO family nonheme iron enzyme [Pelodictyon phaeoclathratiforme]|nr:SUMF1/EgtB/PvdO family nonheme iron enzyme [Pelodictyon phaeoclathratiforme]